MTNMMILHLPAHILTSIFKLLSLQDIFNLLLSCKSIHYIIKNDNILWRYIAETNQQTRTKRLIIHSKEIKGCHREIWYNNCRASYNWCNGFFKNKVILQHRGNYMPWIRLTNSEQLLVTVGNKLHCYGVRGFPNCNKLLWTIDTPDVKRHDIRTNDISRFILNGNILACGNRDGSTAVYRVDNIRYKPELLYHVRDCHNDGNAEVTAVEVLATAHGSYVITASIDMEEIRFWHQDFDQDNFASYKIYRDIFLDDVGVKSMAITDKGDKLAIGPNAANNPLVVDVETGRFLISLNENSNIRKAVRDVQWHDENLLVYVTHSGGFRILDIRSDRLAYSAMDPFHSTLYCVKSDGRRAFVAGSSEYSRCVLYDLCKPTHVQMYFTQKRCSPVYSLDFNTSTLLAAVDRGVAALNFDVPTPTLHQRDFSDVFQSS